MKINFLLTAFTLTILSSCSTAYKTGQTPDDVYYSPVRLQTDEVRRDEDKNVTDNTVYTSSDDYEIRRRIHNRRYRRYDDRYNTYGYPANPKTSTTQNNQPRKTNLGGYNPTVPDSARSTNPKLGIQNNNTSTNPVRTFGNSGSTQNKGTGVGNFIRNFITGGSSGSSTTTTTDNGSAARTFDNKSSSSGNSSGSSNSNNSSGSKSSSSSSSAPVRTFKN